MPALSRMFLSRGNSGLSALALKLKSSDDSSININVLLDVIFFIVSDLYKLVKPAT